MVKKSFFKECLRSIRGSFSCFHAIFLIVALSASFWAVCWLPTSIVFLISCTLSFENPFHFYKKRYNKVIIFHGKGEYL